MKFEYITSGTCSRRIILEIEDDILQSVKFEGGCNGNLKGISSICKGMSIDEVIDKLDGITCGFKPTSCPDQLAKALKRYKEQ
jgi:uncharacterized protein (TIGR03905 family)